MLKLNLLHKSLTLLGASFLIAGFMGITSTQVKAQEVLKIGTEGAYPPFNFMDKAGKVAGFDIDIANAVCAKMKKKCEFVIQDWDGIIPALKAKKFDAIFASMSITEDRQKEIDFAGPYYQTPARFAAKKGAYKDDKPETLKGIKIGVQRASIHQAYIQDIYPQSKLVLYATQEEAQLDLAAGRVDAVMADSIVLEDSFLKTAAGKGFAFFGGDHSVVKYHGIGVGVGVRKGSPELVKSLNEAIKAIYADGTYKKINDKYFAINVWANLK